MSESRSESAGRRGGGRVRAMMLIRGGHEDKDADRVANNGNDKDD